MTMMRNWFFSLGLLFSLGLASLAVADESAAIAAIEGVGGTVRVIAQDSDAKEAAFHLSGKDVTDDGLAGLKEVSNLVWLNLRGTKITDTGLEHLSGIASLTHLHLELTGITDAGLTHLKGLENLEYLNLYGTKVTDAGLEQLKGLKKLKRLYVWQTEVSKEGAEGLVAQIPDLYINRGADAEPGPPTKTLAMGRFVKVRLEGEKRILQLAEVQILETGTGNELQKEGKASQSADHLDTDKAEKAIDGNIDGDHGKGSVSHTAESTNPWWLVDLGEAKDIGKIVIHNRSDCCGDRLKDAIVEVFDASLTIVSTEKIADAKDGSVHEIVAK
ncbi:MAG: discoidin domain-containing protein [Planctomycetales bacterium]|nr:discoidin domain-containing protein [Planctomycetales bacterium]